MKNTLTRMMQGLSRCTEPSTDKPAAAAAKPKLIKHTNFCRSTLSARAPAGRVNRKKGSDATVDISEIKNGESVKVFIIQVAALSWAATQVPEITVAIQSFLNTGFLNAVQVELSFIIGCLHLVTKAARSPEFQEILFLNAISAVIVGETRNSL